MITLLWKLYRIHLLTLKGLVSLVLAIQKMGVNLMVLLQVAARLHPHRIAVTDDKERLTYAQLLKQTEMLAENLIKQYGVREKQDVAILCRNHAVAIKTIFAISRLGGNVFMLNPEMSSDQIVALQDRFQFDFFVYDQPLATIFVEGALSKISLPAYHSSDVSIDQLSTQPNLQPRPLGRATTGKVVVLTGGTTGQPKSVSRKPSLFDFLPPFFALLTQAHLDRYQSIYIAPPICHGYGLALLLIGMVLGAEMYFTECFKAPQACALIAKHDIEVVIVVPLMLERMLKHDTKALSSLRCVLAGSAVLRPDLTQGTLEKLGPVLFNLYGTSEAGFSIIATPDTLGQKPDSIGKPVSGVTAKITKADQVADAQQIGQLLIRSRWSAKQNRWIETGDLAYQDADGDLFLCGRTDDMIVSGGQNVYPVELEKVLAQHPAVDNVAVLGIPDEEFGQRLKAVIVLKSNAGLDETSLRAWLKSRIARYQMPAVIEFRDELPYTSIGKVDKKALYSSL